MMIFFVVAISSVNSSFLIKYIFVFRRNQRTALIQLRKNYIMLINKFINNLKLRELHVSKFQYFSKFTLDHAKSKNKERKLNKIETIM